MIIGFLMLLWAAYLIKTENWIGLAGLIFGFVLTAFLLGGDSHPSKATYRPAVIREYPQEGVR